MQYVGGVGLFILGGLGGAGVAWISLPVPVDAHLAQAQEITERRNAADISRLRRQLWTLQEYGCCLEPHPNSVQGSDLPSYGVLTIYAPHKLMTPLPPDARQKAIGVKANTFFSLLNTKTHKTRDLDVNLVCMPLLKVGHNALVAAEAGFYTLKIEQGTRKEADTRIAALQTELERLEKERAAPSPAALAGRQGR